MSNGKVMRAVNDLYNYEAYASGTGLSQVVNEKPLQALAQIGMWLRFTYKHVRHRST